MTYQLDRTDSQELKKLEGFTRSRLFSDLFKGVPVIKSAQASFVSSHKSYTSGYLLGYSYLVNREYTSLDAVMEDISNNGDDAEQAWFDQCNIAFSYMTILQRNPFLTTYAELLTSIIDTLNKAKIVTKTQDRVTEAIHDILSHLLDYTQGCREYFEYMKYKSIESMTADVKPQTYNQSSPTDSDARTPAETIIDDLLQKLAYLFADPDVYDELVKFLLTPSLGSCGIDYLGDYKFPLALNVMQYDPTITQSHVYWKIRNESPDALDKVDPLLVDDSDLQRLEGLSLKSLRNDSYRNHRDALLKEIFKDKVQDNETGDQNDFGFSFQKPPTPGNRGKKQKKKNPPPPFRHGQSSHNQAPATPDDDDYTPDHVLASLVRDYTRKAHSAGFDISTHDHMTRFNTTSEGAQPISESQVRRGKGSDWTIIKRTNLGNQKYVVTYTRKSKKPIFNAVS